MTTLQPCKEGSSILDQNDVVDKRCHRPLRVTFLAVIPSPYMVDLFEAIHQDRRFHLKVHYLEKPALAAPGVYWRERPLPSYASVLSRGSFFPWPAHFVANTGFFRTLDEDRPDVVVVMGYSSLTYQFAMYWLWAKRIPWIFWGEVPGLERRGVVGRMLRWLALRPAVSLANGIAAIGSRAAGVYTELSHRRRPVWNIPYYCRNDTLLSIDRVPSSPQDTVHFLYCGQLVLRKGVDILVKAFCRLAEDHENVRLTVVGDGPMRETLATSVPDAIRPRVTWAGFKEIEELPSFFAAANVFVLPSLHDGWGVVINQAVSAGMAVIASDAVGAAVDLVEHGTNGLIFPVHDENSLTASLRFFAENPEVISRFGHASRERASCLSPKQGAERWYRFTRRILDKKAERDNSKGISPEKSAS